MQTPDPIQVSGYSPKGHGMCRIGQKRRVEVPRTLDGECIELEPYTKPPRRRGRLKRVLEASPLRARPFCPHFDACGGCVWQHMDLGEQRRLKEQKIRALFEPFGQAEAVLPLIAPDKSRHYRNKMEFSFTEGRFEQTVGLMPYFGGPVAVDIEQCHIADPWVGSALKATRRWWKETGHRAFHHRTAEGALRTLTLRTQRTREKMAILTVSGDPRFALGRSEIEAFTAAMEQTTGDPLSVYLAVHQAIKGKPTQIYTMHLAGPTEIQEQVYVPGRKDPLHLVIGPHTFFQPNTAGAELILQKLTDRLKPSSGLLVDLYCGAGLLGLSQAHRFEQVVGIELIAEAALDGQEAMRRSHIENMRFFSGPVHELLAQESLKPAACIIDPPREGCVKALDQILELGAPQLVYVSCNPKTQAVDIEELIKGGYRLKSVQPIDQFPHTVHVESLAYLVKG